MLPLIFLHFITSNTLAKVSCLKTDINSYIGADSKTSKIISMVVKNHELVFTGDSCGVHGCEYFIFSEVFPGCRVLSFNKKGFLAI